MVRCPPSSTSRELLRAACHHPCATSRHGPRGRPRRAHLLLSVVPGGASATARAATAEAAPRATVKPPLSGLLDRDGPPPKGLRKLVRSYVVNVRWKSLQPSPRRPHHRRPRPRPAGGEEPELPGQAADHGRHPRPGLGQAARRRPGAADGPARQPDRRRPALLDGRVRGGVRRPPAAAGRPVRRQGRRRRGRGLAVHAPSTPSRSSGRPRTPATGRRSSPRATPGPPTRRATGEQVTAHRVWKRTRSGLAFNPAQFVTASGGRTVDDRFTAAMMRHCRDQLGSRCILENNSIRSPIASLDPNPKRPHYQRMYRAMVRHHPARAFQTATAARMGKCARTLDWAVDRKAHYVELPWNATDGLLEEGALLGRPQPGLTARLRRPAPCCVRRRPGPWRRAAR